MGSSDADSDVLADYVLALIRAETPEPELRLNAIENLEDFLKDSMSSDSETLPDLKHLLTEAHLDIDTATFVDAIFVALHTRSYMPGHVPLETPPLVSHSYVAPTTSSITYPQAVTSNGAHVDSSQSRKRSYNDRSDETDVGDSHYGRGDRQMKQMRRGGSKNGRAELFNAKGGRGAFSPYTTPPVPQETPLNFPNMPVPPPGLPFDLNDPLTTMMALQTLGIPPFPGMPIQPQTGLQPSLPQTGLQTNSHQFGTHASPIAELSNKTKINARCRDYDTKGYCARGNSCPFEHGNDHVIVPGQDGRLSKFSIFALG